jgi:hypothetical protein
MSTNSQDIGKFGFKIFLLGAVIQIAIVYGGPSSIKNLINFKLVFPKLLHFVEILSEDDKLYYSNYLWFNLLYFCVFFLVLILVCLIYSKNDISIVKYKKNIHGKGKKDSLIVFFLSFSFGIFLLHYLVFEKKWGVRFFPVENFVSFLSYLNTHILFNFICSGSFLLFSILGFIALFLTDWRES